MRIHKGRDASYDLDKERQYNWWKAKPGRKLNGPVTQLSRQELTEFAEREGITLSDNCTFRAVRHA